MPFKITKEGKTYELRLAKSNKLLGIHKTEKEAKNQIKAIEASNSYLRLDYSIIDGLRFERSERKNKKLKVFKDGKWIHFGDNRYEHFLDRTGLLNPELSHYDMTRRHRYLSRALKIKNKNGELTAYDDISPNYFSTNILW
jgi:hypothetical protein